MGVSRSRKASPWLPSPSTSSMSAALATARCSTVKLMCPFRRRRYRLLSPHAWNSDDPRSACPGAHGGAFARVMDEHPGGVEASLEVSQERQDGGDVGHGVLVDAV